MLNREWTTQELQDAIDAGIPIVCSDGVPLLRVDIHTKEEDGWVKWSEVWLADGDEISIEGVA